jgi:hypothetical protein
MSSLSTSSDVSQPISPLVVGPHPVLTQQDLAKESVATDWLWQGYLARGNMTLLTSQWKSGKTTLLTALLAQLKRGGELGGLPVQQGKALIVTEEAPGLWSERNAKLDLGDHLWVCRPFRCCLEQTAWANLIDQLVSLHAAHGVSLIVLDPLSAFLPGYAESDLGRLKPLLSALRGLADLGPAVLLLHHPRKGSSMAGQASRGHGMLTSFADIVIEMFPFRRADEDDRRRRLQGYSRHECTPLQWVIELNPEGTAYTGHGDVSNSDYLHEWPTLHHLLSEAKCKSTQKDLLEAWPPDVPKPAFNTLWRWLDRAAKEGLVLKSGQGRKQSPYRYCLPGQEEEWMKNPLYTPSPDEIMEMVENFWKEKEKEKEAKRPEGGG